jgi:hypothetical protein
VTGTRRLHLSSSKQNRNRLCRIGTACRRFAPALSLFVAWPSAARASQPDERRAVDSTPASEPRGTETSTKTEATAKVPLSVYATAGLGGSTIGLTARGLFTVAYGHWFVGATASASDEFDIGGPSPNRRQEEFGGLVGIHSRGRFYVAGAGAGLAYVHSVDRGAYLSAGDDGFLSGDVYERIEGTTIGIPIVAHASLYWGPVGIGAMTFLDLNESLTSLGAAGTLSLGVF